MLRRVAAVVLVSAGVVGALAGGVSLSGAAPVRAQEGGAETERSGTAGSLPDALAPDSGPAGDPETGSPSPTGANLRVARAAESGAFPAPPRAPEAVTLGFYIYDLRDVDLKTGTFAAAFYFWTRLDKERLEIQVEHPVLAVDSVL